MELQEEIIFEDTPAPSSAPVLRLERRRTKREKPRARSRPPAELEPTGPLGVVDSWRLAMRPRSRLAFTLGALLGVVVPFLTFRTAHSELDLSDQLWTQPAAWFVLGGLLFSAVTVYGWGALAFRHRGKALGFVVLLEGTMVTSHTPWLAVVALIYLCGINGVATACNLAEAQQWNK
jgi:hypothetical protein